MAGTLYLVATPIGNLGDLTFRAREVLSSVSFVACEDTRRSRVLLDHYGIRKELVSLPAFAEGERAGRILDRVEGGEDCAAITDAGSPGISDPGEKLVAAALSASGLPTGRFHFLGFLPRKGPDRRALLEEIASLRATVVLYESPRRLGETLAELAQVLGDRRACVAREITKVHEEFVRGTLAELARAYRDAEVLGEIVVIVEGRAGAERWTEEEVRRALEEGLERGEKRKALATEIARRAGWSGQEVYRLGLSSP